MRTVWLLIVGGAGNNGAGAGALPAAGGAGAAGAGCAVFAAGAGVGNLGNPKRGVCGEAAQVATQWSCAPVLCALIARPAANAHTMNARRTARFDIFPPRNSEPRRRGCYRKENHAATATALALRCGRVRREDLLKGEARRKIQDDFEFHGGDYVRRSVFAGGDARFHDVELACAQPKRGGFGGDARFIGFTDCAWVERGVDDFARALLVVDGLDEIEFAERGLERFPG